MEELLDKLRNELFEELSVGSSEGIFIGIVGGIPEKNAIFEPTPGGVSELTPGKTSRETPGEILVYKI